MVNNDAILVSRAALTGDKEAFCRLVERYQPSVRGFLFRLSGNEETSKDIAQETFVRAWLGIGSFRSLSKFSTWLFRIAYNVFYDYERSQKDFENIDENINFVNQIVDTKRINDAKFDFQTALQKLKTAERTAMLLFYQDDRSVKEISKIMNAPTGTVKSHLARGKEKLVKFLENAGYE